ncbi:ATPase, T2SS/T4P/T4SS family [Halobium salinum]|uniref:ATPase, T2SS/T4P/T4SS family n=1 Tax=Halobium salinum TaxID=1364940 RepID=A0ABD5P7R3_9EURY|nr:ATPase, T2SS/T4P/T4SS family [Halobium salinum]
MAIDIADDADSGEGTEPEEPAESTGDGVETDTSGGDSEREVARVGEYTWREFLEEHGYDSVADELYPGPRAVPGSDRWDEEEEYEPTKPVGDDWDRVDFDPGQYLGFHPDDLEPRVAVGGGNADALSEYFESFCDPETTPVVKDEWLWEHYKREYYYDEDGDAPRDADGEKEPFSREEALGSGFDPERIESVLSRLADRADELDEVVDERTVDVDEELDEDAFFSTAAGQTTIANRYDLEKAVPMAKKTHFREVERYWVNEPYAFVVVFHSTKENEKKYYLVEPYRNEIESDLGEFLTGKLRTAIKYDDEAVVDDTEGPDGDAHRRTVIEDRTYDLLDRYDLYSRESGGSLGNALADRLGIDGGAEGLGPRVLRALGWEAIVENGNIEGIAARPEPAVLEDDAETLTEYEVRKLLYYLERDFIGYERIDGIKHDINVEDVSCDGYDSPVFVYHGDYEQIISNVYHGRTELDDFVVKLAQRSGKGISKRRPQVDATLPDGSRAQLTLGKEVSDHGTNYTIRQFKDVPFTPIDLINWKTFSLDEMAFLWLCIENDKSLIFAGGTASGKTTSLNAVSLFIPSNAKIVSIEDTREVELPQRNWIASVTRPSFSDDDKGDVDEFDLLEAALRQRPDYIVMGEIRGEEGRTAFQVMSTGHTTYTTFHADSVGEVLKRFTTEPINVSKTMFTALDLVSIQTSTRVQGRKVRRNKSLTEINHYDPENDEINVQDVFQWQAESDEFLKMGDSNTFNEIMFDRGWSADELAGEQFRRQVVIAYLIVNGLNTYAQVAATLQAFINDPPTIVSLMARDGLETSLEDLREMESVLIDVDPEKEEMVPRPDPPEDVLAEAEAVLARAEEELFPEFRDRPAGSVADALAGVEADEDVEATPGAGEGFDRSGPDDPQLDAPERRPDELDGPADDERTPALDEGPTDSSASGRPPEGPPTDESPESTADGDESDDRPDGEAAVDGFADRNEDEDGDPFGGFLDGDGDGGDSTPDDGADVPAGDYGFGGPGPDPDPDERGESESESGSGRGPAFGPPDDDSLDFEADGSAFVGSAPADAGEAENGNDDVDDSTGRVVVDDDGAAAVEEDGSDTVGEPTPTDRSVDSDGPEAPEDSDDWGFGEFEEADPDAADTEATDTRNDEADSGDGSEDTR